MAKITIRPYLRIIGDVHGHLRRYVELANEAQYSIQLGDVGFDYSYIHHRLSYKRHRIVGGNHDNYTEGPDRSFTHQTPHFLGDFGIHTIPDFGEIFFVRGGYSLDVDMRTPGVNWWDREQLDHESLIEAVELYKQRRPEFVVTHECPRSLIPEFSTMPGKRVSPSRTAEALDQMFTFDHKPKRWLFGHHHQDKILEFKGTLFQCLNELSYVDFARK